MAAGGFFVSNGDAAGASFVYHYSATGKLLSTASFPAGDGGIRDIVVDAAFHIQAFDGALTPNLVTRSGSTFRQHTIAGWSIANATDNGGIASLNNFVYLSDQRVGADGPTDRGIIRYDSVNGFTSQRFATGLDVYDLSIGMDGLLYALSGTAAGAAGRITAFDPVTMSVVRTVTPPGTDNRAVAADKDGNIYVGSFGAGRIYKLNSSGAQLKSVNTFADDFDVSSDGVLLARTGASATTFDANLNVIDTAPIRVADTGAAFLTWDTPQFPPQPQDVSGRVVNDANDNGAEDGPDAPLVNWRVYVDANGNGAYDNNEKSDLTDANGDYTIAAVPPGLFKLRQVRQGGYRQTSPSRRTYYNVLIDSNALEGLTFLNTQKARLSGVVFGDGNSNGVRDRVDGGMSFRTVFIDANDNGVLDNGETYTLSDRRGNYEFDGVSAGAHVIRLVRPRGYTQTGPAGAKYAVNLSNGQVVTGKNFGLRPRH